MRKFRLNIILIALIILLSVLSASASDIEKLDDGRYSAIFTTDSSMFNVCEVYEGRGILTVKDGEMMLHVALSSKNIVNLFPGFAEDAKKDDAELLEPIKEEVTYSDGFQDTVYAYDIPVPYLNEDFDLALIGKKGKWYDHKVNVSDPVRLEDEPIAEITDGIWLCDVVLSGGSGKASVSTPAELTVADGEITAVLVWSSPNYEYMLFDDVRYEPINQGGNSTFEIPVLLGTELPVSASTLAMSQPHLIDYTLYFDSASLQPVE